jgi:hypothetical protein
MRRTKESVKRGWDVVQCRHAQMMRATVRGRVPNCTRRARQADSDADAQVRPIKGFTMREEEM